MDACAAEHRDTFPKPLVGPADHAVLNGDVARESQLTRLRNQHAHTHAAVSKLLGNPVSVTVEHHVGRLDTYTSDDIRAQPADVPRPGPDTRALIERAADVNRPRAGLEPKVVRPSAINGEADLACVGRCDEPMILETVHIEVMSALGGQPAQAQRGGPRLLAAEEEADGRWGGRKPSKVLSVGRHAHAVGFPKHPSAIDLLRVRHQPIDAEVRCSRSDNFFVDIVLAVGKRDPALVYVDRQPQRAGVDSWRQLKIPILGFEPHRFSELSPIGPQLPGAHGASWEHGELFDGEAHP